MCAAYLALQVPYISEPIEEHDIVGGSMKHCFIGYSPQYGGGNTYYCHFDAIKDALDSIRDKVDMDYITLIEKMRTLKNARYLKNKLKRNADTEKSRTISAFSYFT